MKLSVSRDSLSAALQLVGRAVSTRGTLPSLGGILVIAADGAVTLRATDMELALTRTVADAKTEQDGTVLLPGRLFADVVRSLPPGEVSLELRGEQRDVEIAGGGGRLHLRTLPAAASYRLSVKHTELEAPVSSTLEANVPARALRELARIVSGEGAEEVEISLARNQAVFRVAGVVLSSRLIEGQFPSWRQLIPEAFEPDARLRRRELGGVARGSSRV